MALKAMCVQNKLNTNGMELVHPQVQRLLAVPQYAQRTPEWYAIRKTLMTASNAAAAIGIKPYESFRGDPREECLNQIVTGSFKGNVATRHGSEHEDMVRDRLCEITGEVALEFGLIVHPKYPWLAASPDGITTSGRMIEIKCPMYREIIPGHVPHHYYPQIQTQMEVCDLNFCIFCQWQPARFSKTGQEIFDITVVERDTRWFEKHKDALYSFWEDLMSRRARYVPPPPPTCLIRDDLYTHLPPPVQAQSMFLNDSSEDDTF